MRYFKALTFAAFAVCLFIVAAPVGVMAAAEVTASLETAAGAVLDAAPANAAAAPVSSFASGLQAVIGLAATALLAFVGFLISQLAAVLKKKFNIEIDEKTRGYLEEALYNAIMFGEKKALEKAAGIKSPFSENQKIGIAADYLFEHVPDALKHFGLTRDKVINLIEARLGHNGDPDKNTLAETKNDKSVEEEDLVNGSA